MNEVAAAVTASCNDPRQRIQVSGRTIFISGAALANGPSMSVAGFTIDGERYQVPLHRNMEALRTYDALRRQLPPGLKLQLTATRSYFAGVAFQVVGRRES